MERYREYSTAGTVQLERWTMLVGGVAQIDTLTVDGGQAIVNPTSTIRYQYRDYLGSSTVEANELGQVISYEEYYAYGSSAYRASAPGMDLSLKRYRFTDKEKDEETGFYYFGVRYYAAWLGRWTSADPGGFVDGINLYRYTRNNPVNGVDVKGYQTDPPPRAPTDASNGDIYTPEGGKNSYIYNNGEWGVLSAVHSTITVRANPSKDQSVDRYDYNGDYEQYQKDYPEFKDVEHANANAYYFASGYADAYQMQIDEWDGKNIKNSPNILYPLYVESKKFARGVRDGGKETIVFTYHLFPFTGHDSWEDIDNSLQNISLVSNSYQDIWWGENSEESQNIVGQFEERIKSIDSYDAGKFTGSMLVGFGSTKAASMLPMKFKPFSLRNGYGVFGQKGLVIKNYKIELLYENTRARAGSGTIFSIKQQKRGGSLFRLDYGELHSTGELGLHTTIRFYWNGTKYGSSAQRYWYPSSIKPPFFKPIPKNPMQ